MINDREKRTEIKNNNSSKNIDGDSAVSGAFLDFVSLIPGFRFSIGMAIATFVIAALYFGRDILIPLALAILLGFLLDPAVTRLKRWGLPRPVSTFVVVLVFVGGILGLGTYLVTQVSQLSSDLPTYQSTIKGKLKNIRSMMEGPSIWDGAFQTYDAFEKEISKQTAANNNSNVQKVEIQEPAGKSWEQMAGWLEKVSTPVATAGIVLLFMILILLDRDSLRDRLLRLMGGDLHIATDALDEASDRIGKYLRMQFIVNVTYGIPMSVGLYFIGVPGALLWGVIATVMRFVPYVGPMISAIFPLILAFAVAPGWDMLLWTLGLILVLELISNNVIEPWLYGSSTGLSTLSIILAATFWTALWGPIGLILSTPLTVCILVLGRYIGSLSFLEVLLGSDPVLDVPQRLYQRLLADDVESAVEISNDTIEDLKGKERSDASTPEAVQDFYDEVGLPLLRLSSQNYSDSATAKHRLRISEGITEMLDDLKEEYPVKEIKSSYHRLVYCLGGRWEVDAFGAHMASHILSLNAHNAEAALHSLNVRFARSDFPNFQDVGSLVISIFNKQPQSLARFIARRINRLGYFEKNRSLVFALWNASNDIVEDLSEQFKEQNVYFVTSFHELNLRFETLRDELKTYGSQDIAQIVPEESKDESERLKYLKETGLIDNAPVEVFHDFAQRAANAFDAKYAQVSLVGDDRVYTPGTLLSNEDEIYEGRKGLDRNGVICSYVVQDGEDLVIPDIARDPRFASNEDLSRLGIKSYAGVPLKNKEGMTLGTLCVLHDEVREFAEEDLEILQEMSSDLTKEIERYLQEK